MDITIPAAAKSLNTTENRIARAIQRLGITPSIERGRVRGRPGHVLNAEEFLQLSDELGTTPRDSNFSREELFVLAAFNINPFGFDSMRSVARVAGVSPTTASEIVGDLKNKGLIKRVSGNTRMSGRVTDVTRFEANRDTSPWREAQDQISATRPPAPVLASEPKMVPRKFWHVFWNANPSTLRVAVHADYIASRMLLSLDPLAIAWASVHLPVSSIQQTAELRGVNEHDRGWLRNIAKSREMVRG